MATPKQPVRDWQLVVGKPTKSVRVGKTKDRKLPLPQRESVRRALMRLPLDVGRQEKVPERGIMPATTRTKVHSPRREYAESIGIRGEALLDLLNRVEGLHTLPSDGHAIAVERINGESTRIIRRRRKRSAS